MFRPATIILIIDLLVMNLLLAVLAYRSFSLPPTNQKIIPTLTPIPTPSPSSPTISVLPTLTPQPSKIPAATSRQPTRRVTYISIPGNGSTLANVWTDLPSTDFYFDTADFPGLTEVYFEANLKLFNGNGIAYARLYDVNHSIGVPGGEVQSTKQVDTAVISAKVNFWPGISLIRIQAKSLTADTTIFNGGRLKIVTLD